MPGPLVVPLVLAVGTAIGAATSIAGLGLQAAAQHQMNKQAAEQSELTALSKKLALYQLAQYEQLEAEKKKEEEMSRVPQTIRPIAMTNMGSGMMTTSMTNTLNQQNIVSNRRFVTPSSSPPLAQQRLFTSSPSLSTLPLESSTPFQQRSGSSRATLPGALTSRSGSNSLSSSRLTLSTAPATFENIELDDFMPSLRRSTTSAAALTPSTTKYITSTTPRRVGSSGGGRFRNFVRRIGGNMKVRYRRRADTKIIKL